MKESSIEEQRKELLTAYFMGDVGEDTEFLGLRMHHILILTFVIIFSVMFVMWAQLPGALSLLIVIGINLFAAASFWLKWWYRIRRFYMEIYSSDEGEAEDIGEYLDVVEEGWLQRSDSTWHVVMKVEPPQSLGWDHAILSTQRKRLGSFENFLRIALEENMEVSIDAEQVPDYQFERWKHMREKDSPSEGLRRLREERIEMMESEVNKDYSLSGEYTVCLSIHDFQLTLMERDDEPPNASKEQIKRYRTIMAIREKVDRVMKTLEQSDHRYSTIAGYNMAEWVGRFWNYYHWKEWKLKGSPWQDADTQTEQAAWLTEIESEDDTMVVNQDQPEEHEDQEDKYEHMINQMVSNEDELLEQLEDQPREKSNRLRSWLAHVSRLKKIVGSIVTLPALILPELKQLTRLGKNAIEQYRTKKALKKVVAVPVDEEIQDDPVTTPIAYFTESVLTLKPTTLLTSSVPSGVSFLAVNIAVAGALEGQTYTVIDLSPDQGSVTVLNSLMQENPFKGWKVWSTSRVPNLKIWVPTWTETSYPSIASILDIIEHHQAKGPVIVDMPWSYPDRKELMDRYHAITVVDSDYHHWLQMKIDMNDFTGEIWMNQAPKHLMKPLTQMIREKWDYPITAMFPFFAQANECLFQGTPLAIDQQQRVHFKAELEQEDHYSEAQTTA